MDSPINISLTSPRPNSKALTKRYRVILIGTPDAASPIWVRDRTHRLIRMEDKDKGPPNPDPNADPTVQSNEQTRVWRPFEEVMMEPHETNDSEDESLLGNLLTEMLNEGI